MLCYVMLCYVMLCYVMLCYVMLYYIILYYIILYYIYVYYIMYNIYVMYIYYILCAVVHGDLVFGFDLGSFTHVRDLGVHGDLCTCDCAWTIPLDII